MKYKNLVLTIYEKPKYLVITQDISSKNHLIELLTKINRHQIKLQTKMKTYVTLSLPNANKINKV